MVDAKQVSLPPNRQISRPVPALPGPGLFPGWAGGAMAGCVCVSVASSPIKGPPCFFAGLPASMHLLVRRGQGAAHQPPTQVGIPTHTRQHMETPRDTHDWWPAGLGLCLSVPVTPSPSHAHNLRAWLPGPGQSPTPQSSAPHYGSGHLGLLLSLMRPRQHLLLSSTPLRHSGRGSGVTPGICWAGCPWPEGDSPC